jgi:hypothetical protein
MDPYIEASGLWRDFHDRLIGELERALSSRVTEQYFVRLAARSYLVPDEDVQNNSSKRTQVAVTRASSRQEKSRGRSNGSSPRGSAVRDPGIQMLAPLDMEENEIFIEINQVRPERRLVTAIEILSPANKQPGTTGWDEYLKKRRVLLNGAANLVEIDLLRNGRRMPMRQAWPNSPYYILTARKEQMPRCQVWCAYAARPLPRLAVPLAHGDMDLEIELQPMVDEIYERAQFGSLIDYKRPITPPLSPPEKKLLARAPKRRAKRGVTRTIR